MSSLNSVYIASIATLNPPFYKNKDVLEMFYPREKVSRKIGKMVSLLGRKVGIKCRSLVIQPELFPEKKLYSIEHTPKNWGKTLLEKVSYPIGLSEIGFISVAYNATSHQNILPNLASQIALESGLNLEQIPSEIAYYGCAAGIFALKEAVDYCQKSQRAAFVYVFDQCSWIMEPIYDVNHLNFKGSLRTHSLFSDGAVGLLIIPEQMREKFPYSLLKIIDINKGFELGNIITMEEEFFLVNEGVCDVMPPLVSKRSIEPLLKNHFLTVQDISEWCIHQGGLPVLEAFTNPVVLGLSPQQIQPSKTLFENYGNMSAPSCLYVLDYFFNKQKKSPHPYGIVTSFGAGYYFASFLYQWDIV